RSAACSGEHRTQLPGRLEAGRRRSTRLHAASIKRPELRGFLHLTSDGRVDLNLAKHAVDAVATELGIPAATVAAATVDQMYLPALYPSRYLNQDAEDLIRRAAMCTRAGQCAARAAAMRGPAAPLSHRHPAELLRCGSSPARIVRWDLQISRLG